MAALQSGWESQVFSPEQHSAILAELETILSSHAFAGSKRCSEFLEFIVKKALAGDFEHLTERFLGVNLFSRPVDYETATDAIVRVRACEVRNRLTRYYFEHPASREAMIKLAPGSYVPEFYWFTSSVSKKLESPTTSLTHDVPKLVDREHEVTVRSISRHRWARPLIFTSVVLGLLSISIVIWCRFHRAPDHVLTAFWNPIFANKGTVDVRLGDCISYGLLPELQHDVEIHRSLINVASNQIVESKNVSVSSGSLQAALSIYALLEKHGIPTRLQLPQDLQNNIRSAPQSIVYIGAFNNPWTLELNRNLRFAFAKKTENEWAIIDQDQAGRIWSTNPYNMDHDYALITRIFDSQHKQILISIGAVSQFGTQAASEFLTDENALRSFEQIAPSGWEHKNLQIVLSMGISDGRVIDPKIVATNIW